MDGQGREEKKKYAYSNINHGQPKKKRMTFTPLTSKEVSTTPFTNGPHMLSFSGSSTYFSYKSQLSSYSSIIRSFSSYIREVFSSSSNKARFLSITSCSSTSSSSEVSLSILIFLCFGKFSDSNFYILLGKLAKLVEESISSSEEFWPSFISIQKLLLFLTFVESAPNWSMKSISRRSDIESKLIRSSFFPHFFIC